jgi:TP901 family phage tail tape measure protein
MSELPTLLLTLRANASDVFATTKGVSTAVDKMEKDTGTSMTSTQKKWAGLGQVSKAVSVAAVGSALAIGVVSVKMAAGFQEATTRLVTGAGESTKNIDMIRQGLIAMAPAVGMGPEALAKGMFLVESAGYHGAAGLQVMKAAAEGAKIGGADATVVANALTTAMTDYGIPTAKAAETTSKLVATVAAGKTNMQDLGTALSAVAPTAAAAHVSLDQMLGAMGTMTGQGISAQQSAQNLAGTIRALSNPTIVMTKNMAQMGLNSMDVAQNLGKRGLTGTMDDLYQAIMSHMGPGGKVLQSAFNESKLAAQSAQMELTKLPASLQTLAKGYMNGTVTQKEWTATLKGQDAMTQNLARQFATTTKQAEGFSQQLRTGQGPASTFNGILAKMTGGATGLSTSLALTGAHSAVFAANVKSVSSATTEAGGHVKGWGETQKDFNVQLAQAGAGLQAVAVTIGGALLPMVTGAIHQFSGFAAALTTNHGLLAGILITVGVLAGLFVAYAVAQKVAAAAMVAYNLVAGIMRATTVASTAALEGQTIGIAASAGAQKAYALGSGIATAAQWAWNAALDANPIGIIVLAIAALVGALIWFFTQTKLGQQIWTNVTKAIVAAWNWLMGVLHPALQILGAIFKWLYESVIKPVADFIGAAFRVIGAIFVWLWQNVALPALQAIGAVFKWLYDSIIKPVAEFIIAYFRILGVVVMWLWQNMVMPAVQGIGVIFKWIWDSIIKPVSDFIIAYFQLLGKAANILWQNYILPALHGIADVFNWVWNSIISPVINWVVNAFNTLGNATHQVFSTMAGIIQGAFSGVAGFIRSAVNGAIGVINGAIGAINTLIRGINSVPGVHIGLIGTIPSLDTGGFVPGAPGQATLAMNHGGEYMLSQRMLAGQQAVDPRVKAAIGGGGGSSGSSSGGGAAAPNITINATSNDPAQLAKQIAQSISWEMWRLG